MKIKKKTVGIKYMIDITFTFFSNGHIEKSKSKLVICISLLYFTQQNNLNTAQTHNQFK